jgi:parallel beta-helix repeat protein
MQHNPARLRAVLLYTLCLSLASIAACDSDDGDTSAQSDTSGATSGDTSGTSGTSGTTSTDTSGATSGDTSGATSDDTSGATSDDTADTADTTEPWTPGADCTVVLPATSTQQEILAAFIDAQDNAILCFAPGDYALGAELSITVNDVTIRGAGIRKTVLDFAPQRDTGVGANGIYVRADGFTIEDITVKNTPGDSIRVEGTSNRFVERVTYSRVHVTWDAGPSAENGSYALYPVFTDNVLIHDCEVSYASDAGVYVGQSRNIIVRDNEVFGNVAGIEVENSFTADVFNNNTHDNTCGILVFDLPDKPQQGGKNTRVFDNDVINNNQANFAPPGNIVGKVPAGVGMLVVSNDENEFFNNTITGNQTTAFALTSYLSLDQQYQPDCNDNLDNDEDTLKDFPADPDCDSPFDDSEEPGKQHYDPYPERNYIHDNIISGNGATPDPRSALVVIIKGLLNDPDTLEDLFWDGFTDPNKDAATNINCWRNNTDGQGNPATWRNLDAPGGAQNTSTTPGIYDCEGVTLPAVDLGR